VVVIAELVTYQHGTGAQSTVANIHDSERGLTSDVTCRDNCASLVKWAGTAVWISSEMSFATAA
jgi:hypothetical protein